MREMGYAYAIIGGVGPAEFYAKVCGATVIEGSDPGVYGHLYREMRARCEVRGTRWRALVPRDNITLIAKTATRETHHRMLLWRVRTKPLRRGFPLV